MDRKINKRALVTRGDIVISRMLNSILIAIIGIILFVGQGGGNQRVSEFDIIKAKQISLQDENGKERILLRSDSSGYAEIAMFDLEGKARVIISYDKDDGSLVSLLDESEKEILGISVYENNPKIGLYSQSPYISTVTIGASKSEGAYCSIRSPSQLNQASIFATDQPMKSGIALVSGKSNALFVSQHEENSRIDLNAEEKSRTSLYAVPNGETALAFSVETGAKAKLGIRQNGNGFLEMNE